MISKKAQAQQVFTYILSIVLIGLILLFGFRAIMDFTSKADKISYVKFKTDLESVVRIMGPDYGSVKREEFTIGDYQQICFVDSGEVHKGASANLGDVHPVIGELVISGTNKNTFLMTDSVEESFDVGQIEIDTPENFLCINSIKGRVRLQFEGMGNRTKVSEWAHQ